MSADAIDATVVERRVRAAERVKRYRARHRDRLLAARREKNRKPCADCGGPKPPGKGIHRCADCETRHKAAQKEQRAARRRKPCRACGGPKPPGPGHALCEKCESVVIDSSTGRVRIREKRRNGSYEYRYRRVMEEHLGRPLRDDEHVHHINGDPSDDRPENLQILSPEEHGRIHGRWTPVGAK